MACIYLHVFTTVFVHVLVIAPVFIILLTCICVLNCLLGTLLPCGLWLLYLKGASLLLPCRCTSLSHCMPLTICASLAQ